MERVRQLIINLEIVCWCICNRIIKTYTDSSFRQSSKLIDFKNW